MRDSLKFIYKEQKELSIYSGISALLGWDQMTYMPKLGINMRSEQNAILSKLIHSKIISDKFWEHIKKLHKSDNFTKLKNKDRLVVDRLYKDIEKSRIIPSSYIERLTKTTTLSYNAWEESRKKNNYKIFLPYLKKIIELKKEYSDIIDIGGHRYNSLLDDYEEGMTVDKLKNEFKSLELKIKKILEKIIKSDFYNKKTDLKININSNNQMKLCNIIISKMGLPKEKTRIDLSTHPFTTSISNCDVRITTNIKEKNPFFSVFSTIHEAGHALYELGVIKGEYIDTVISDSPSFGLHESQSRFWENMIGKNKLFWNFFYPYIKKHTNAEGNKKDLNILYNNINQVEPSPIRIESDELTYCLHIILRFYIELKLLSDEIHVDELPQLWNEKIYDLLRIKPKNNLEGILQDMHWSVGSFGYFPSYAIGSIYASQIFYKMQKDISTFDIDLEKGNFSNLHNWLKIKIYDFGRMKTADEIIKNACGQKLNSDIYIKYLEKKYYDIYNCH
jgi:carboxypeptidase Taq